MRARATNRRDAFLLNTGSDLRRALLSDAILDYHDVITRQTRARRFVKLRANASFIPFGIKCRALGAFPSSPISVER